MNNQKLEYWLKQMPLVAILRGVTPCEVVSIGRAIVSAGIGIIEVPLNSPDAISSIAQLNAEFGGEYVVGCGTLVDENLVPAVANAGATIAVTPATQTGVIKACIEASLTVVPGWFTPTEAFAAYRAGARYLKMFPASTLGEKHLKAVIEVLPDDARVFAVGGVGEKNSASWLRAGAAGVGVGGDIYRAGMSADDVSQRAQRLVTSIRSAQNG